MRAVVDESEIGERRHSRNPKRGINTEDIQEELRVQEEGTLRPDCLEGGPSQG